MADISSITLPGGNSYNFKDAKLRQDAAKYTSTIPYGHVDSTSTSTVFTATVDGVTDLHDGVSVMLYNGVVSSTSGCTLNVNGLGAKPIYSNMAAATREAGTFYKGYTIIFVYDSTRVAGGCWIYYRGHYSDTQTALRLGYGLKLKKKVGRYVIVVTDADGYVFPLCDYYNNPSANKELTTDSFNPFGGIYQNISGSDYNAGSNLASNLALTYSLADCRYTFNLINGTITFIAKENVYIRCIPQTDGMVKLDGNDCLTQTLPSSKDGKVYILLGYAYDGYRILLFPSHPIYYYNSGIRLWSNSISTTEALIPASGSIDSNGVITFKNAANASLFTIQIPIYTTVGSSWELDENGILAINPAIT